MAADAPRSAANDTAQGAAANALKKEDPLAGVKAALDAQMRNPPFARFDTEYAADEFQDCRFTELSPWGRDQTFTGLTHGTHKGAQTPHGWGSLEHHEGFSQACSMWRDGVPDGMGMWTLASQTPGEEQCGYGTWIDGKRDGYFALVKEGGVYVEDYQDGELKRRIKWRKDKLHVKCTRCNTLFVRSANIGEKFCRFHWNQPDINGRYPCCGALQSANPRGCATNWHVEPGGAETQGVDGSVLAPRAAPAHVPDTLLNDMLSDFAALGTDDFEQGLGGTSSADAAAS